MILKNIVLSYFAAAVADAQTNQFSTEVDVAKIDTEKFVALGKALPFGIDYNVKMQFYSEQSKKHLTLVFDFDAERYIDMQDTCSCAPGNENEWMGTVTLSGADSMCLKSDHNEVPICFTKVDAFFWVNEPDFSNKWVDASWQNFLWQDEEPTN